MTPTNGGIVLQGAPAVMLAIAQCESQQQQFNDDGSVVYNPVSKDYGIFQINKIHLKDAKARGYDIMTAEGNIGYALYLYHIHGTRDWNASKGCWGAGGGSA